LGKQFSGSEKHSDQLSKQRDGINLGAVLMFVGTLKAMLLTTLMRPDSRGMTTLFIMIGMLILLLVLRPLAQAVSGLFFKKGPLTEELEAASAYVTSDLEAQLDVPKREVALPPAQSIPVDNLASPRARTPEMAEPPSVTEQTTRLLDKG
jgi:hypothetical protein